MNPYHLFSIISPNSSSDHIQAINILQNTTLLLTLLFCLFNLMSFRKKLKEKEQKIKELEQLTHFHQFLIRAFSHDLKNKLFVCISGLKLLSREPKAEELAPIELSLQQINNAITNLRNLNKENDIEIHPQPTKVKSLIESLSQVWAFSFKSRKIDFKIINNGLDEILIDPSFMNLVWENLLSHAYQHTPANGHVWIFFDQNESHHQIFFRNSGPTLPEKEQEHLFDFEGDLDSYSSYHTGLSLNYTTMMCKKHGGRISYRVNADKMNEFIIELPKCH